MIRIDRAYHNNLGDLASRLVKNKILPNDMSVSFNHTVVITYKMIFAQEGMGRIGLGFVEHTGKPKMYMRLTATGSLKTSY